MKTIIVIAIDDDSTLSLRNSKALRHFFYQRIEKEGAKKWRGECHDSTDGALKRWATGGEFGKFQKWWVRYIGQMTIVS
jgi:hypothetical protein